MRADLVEGLAGGVVEGLAEHLVAVRGRGPPASRVWPPLATRQRKGGSSGSGSRKLAATWPCRWSTGISGSRARRGDRLRGADADQQGADQARAGGDRDRLDLVERRRPPRPAPPRPPATASSRWWREATSGTTPPKRGVRRGLRGDHVGEDPRRRRAPPRRCRRRRSRSQGSRRIASTQSSHMISASSPLSW